MDGFTVTVATGAVVPIPIYPLERQREPVGAVVQDPHWPHAGTVKSVANASAARRFPGNPRKSMFRLISLSSPAVRFPAARFCSEGLGSGFRAAYLFPPTESCAASVLRYAPAASPASPPAQRP